MAADWYKEITGLGHAVVKKTRLSNAMGTPLVLVVLVAVPCFIIYGFTQFWPVLIIAVIPVLYFIRAFDYIMKHDPNLLRTEEHEERMLQIRVGAMGHEGAELSEDVVDALPAVPATIKDKVTEKKTGTLKEGARK